MNGNQKKEIELEYFVRKGDDNQLEINHEETDMNEFETNLCLNKCEICKEIINEIDYHQIDNKYYFHSYCYNFMFCCDCGKKECSNYEPMRRDFYCKECYDYFLETDYYKQLLREKKHLERMKKKLIKFEDGQLI